MWPLIYLLDGHFHFWVSYFFKMDFVSISPTWPVKTSKNKTKACLLLVFIAHPGFYSLVSRKDVKCSEIHFKGSSNKSYEFCLIIYSCLFPCHGQWSLSAQSRGFSKSIKSPAAFLLLLLMTLQGRPQFRQVALHLSST